MATIKARKWVTTYYGREYDYKVVLYDGDVAGAMRPNAASHSLIWVARRKKSQKWYIMTGGGEKKGSYKTMTDAVIAALMISKIYPGAK